MTTKIHYQDENIIFSASNIAASFGDDDTTDLPLDNVTYRSSVVGDELILSSTSQKDKIVKLVMIQPLLDWRKDQSYIWKLDNGWMTDKNYGWIHWNSNSYIDSIIQIPSSCSNNNNNNNTVLLFCDTMEFHFTPILPTGFSRAYDQVIPSTKVVISNVQIGLFNKNHTSSKEEFQYYNPCTHQTTTTIPKKQTNTSCTIIDGSISSGIYYGTTATSYALFFEDRPIWQLLILIATALLVFIFLIYIVVRLCIHYQRTKRYQEINPINMNREDEEDYGDDDSHDLALKVEEEDDEEE